MIRMATELLLESEQDPNKINYVNSINSSMNVLYARVNDRNDFKLINKGMFRPQMQVFNLKDAFMEILQFFHLQALIKKQQFVIQFEKMVPLFCYSDKLRLQQILANLASNAIKFSGNNTIMIGVEFDADNSMLCVMVRDEGQGIHENQEQSIFEFEKNF